MWSRGTRGMGRPPRGPRGISWAGRLRERLVRTEEVKRPQQRITRWVRLRRQLRTALRWFVLRPVRTWLVTGPLRHWFPRPTNIGTGEQTGVTRQFPR